MPTLANSPRRSTPRLNDLDPTPSSYALGAAVRDTCSPGERIKLFSVERDGGVAGCGVVLIGVVSASHRKADDLVPGGEAGGHFPAVGIGVQPVTAGDGSGVICR
jgi:hypothetical protein